MNDYETFDQYLSELGRLNGELLNTVVNDAAQLAALPIVDRMRLFVRLAELGLPDGAVGELRDELTRQKNKKTNRANDNGSNYYDNGAGDHSDMPDEPPWMDDMGEETATPALPRFPRLSLAQVMKMPPKEWDIDQIIGKRDLGMLYGAPGSGKTFVGFDLAFAACLGRPFAGRFGVARPLTVAYAAGEGSSGLAQRLQAAAEFYGVEDVPNLHIYMTAPQLFNTQDPCNAARFVEEYAMAEAGGEVEPLDVLILDTLHSVSYGAGENDSKDMGEIINQAKRIADRLGCAVILIHHTNKAGTGYRGSSSLEGAMDVMIEVKEVGNGRIMTCEKLKDGEKWKPQTFDLIAKADSVRVEWGDVGSTGKNDATPAKLVVVLRDNVGMRFTAKSLAEAVGVSSGTCFVALNRLTEKGEVKRELEDKSKPSSTRNPWVYFVTE